MRQQSQWTLRTLHPICLQLSCPLLDWHMAGQAKCQAACINHQSVGDCYLWSFALLLLCYSLLGAAIVALCTTLGSVNLSLPMQYQCCWHHYHSGHSDHVRWCTLYRTVACWLNWRPVCDGAHQPSSIAPYNTFVLSVL